MNSTERGFSLVELMIVVVIVGALSAVAYPSYLDHVRRSHRNDARAALTRAANDLERFFATAGAYTTDLSNTSLEIINGKAHSDNGFYLVTAAAGPTGSIATSYSLTAAAIEGKGQHADELCRSLTVDSAGRRTPDPLTTSCW